ncbi:hypothetical protein H6G81_16985 [Scytonema hofmannii FACHB-248]|uniref:Uncharacterized protein n=1 Tax=Scytonema hofmannii FACHB-248 TaxID=1842502 RepID=A0ABR8GST2_9CYAN|nr:MULTISPECIES: hypothetical protein [Nostocales]MBD2606175.1 hypothetical protein [Scytonema hofmannii FACHB-248]
MKRIIAGIIVALPLAIASIPTSASALEVIVNPRVHASQGRPVYVARGRQQRRVYIPGHWERTRQGRRWVRAHYEYR